MLGSAFGHPCPSEVEFENHTIGFKYKSQVVRHTGEKRFKTVQMDIFEFMARMLYFLPEKHEKSVRYYGYYVRRSKELRAELKRSKASWSYAIEYCFNKNPKKCPECRIEMDEHVIKSFQKFWILRDLRENYFIKDGYFYPESYLTKRDIAKWSNTSPARGP